MKLMHPFKIYKSETNRDAVAYANGVMIPVCQLCFAGDTNTRDVFYVRREVDLMKTAKVNAYIMHIFGKIELLYIHAT